MKKALFSALSILAIAHLVALAGFITFLGVSDRLSRDRLEQIRSILAVTITQQQEQTERTRQAEQEAAEQARREAQTDVANAGVESRNERFRTIEQAQQEIVNRAQRDVEAINQLIELRLAEVERREAELARREQEVLDAIERDRTLAKDEQFQKTVSLLAGLKPDDLKAKVDVYLADERYDFVVDLLEALPARTASKLLALYADQTDNRLAANLLLRLKDRGTGAAPLGIGDGTSSNQQP